MKSLSVLALGCVLLVSACGGGGGGGDEGGPTGLPVSSLAGTWGGTLEDGAGAMHTLSVTVGTSGNITQILIDAVNQNLTGTITKSGSGSLFTFVLSDATEGGFIADASGNHAGFLDDGSNFGVIQKGAAALPTYAAADIAGTWSGYGVTLNATFDVTRNFSSGATVQNNGTRTFSGTDFTGAFSGSFPTTTLPFGRWIGTYTNSGGAGAVRAFLSIDKTFAATWACANGGTFPASCSFSAWNK